jgi:DNA-binding response OmpR family regulator
MSGNDHNEIELLQTRVRDLESLVKVLQSKPNDTAEILSRELRLTKMEARILALLANGGLVTYRCIEAHLKADGCSMPRKSIAVHISRIRSTKKLKIMTISKQGYKLILDDLAFVQAIIAGSA